MSSHHTVCGGRHFPRPFTCGPQYGGGLSLFPCKDCGPTKGRRRCVHMTHGQHRYFYTSWSKSFELRFPNDSDATAAKMEFLIDGRRKLQHLQSLAVDAPVSSTEGGPIRDDQIEDGSIFSVSPASAVRQQEQYVRRLEKKRNFDRLTTVTKMAVREETLVISRPRFTEDQYDHILDHMRSDITADHNKVSAATGSSWHLSHSEAGPASKRRRKQQMQVTAGSDADVPSSVISRQETTQKEVSDVPSAILHRSERRKLNGMLTSRIKRVSILQ